MQGGSTKLGKARLRVAEIAEQIGEPRLPFYMLLSLIREKAHIPHLLSHISCGLLSSRCLHEQTTIRTFSRKAGGVARTIPLLPQCGKTSTSSTVETLLP